MPGPILTEKIQILKDSKSYSILGCNNFSFAVVFPFLFYESGNIHLIFPFGILWDVNKQKFSYVGFSVFFLCRPRSFSADFGLADDRLRFFDLDRPLGWLDH